MMKIIVMMSVLIVACYSLTCQSTIIKDYANYSITFDYDYLNKVIKYTYSYPIDIIEYYDYNTHIKYKLNDTVCENYYFYKPFPIIRKLETDIYIDSLGNTELYKRNNDYILNYTITTDGIITEIYYNDSTYQQLYNCYLSEVIKPDLSYCSNSICAKNGNIIFVIEESEFITEYEYDIIKNIINNTINSYDSAKFGIISYGENSRIISNLTNNKYQLYTTIYNMYQYKGGSCISCGLNSAINMLNKDDLIILINSGISNKPVINGKKHKCKSLGNCKKSCNSNNIINKNCNEFCNSNCYNNTCFIFNETSNLYNINIQNNQCLINGQLLQNDCCINGPDLCCCELIDVINDCYDGEYNNTSLENTLHTIKSNNINLININIRHNLDILNNFAIKSFNINTINEINNIDIALHSCNLFTENTECYKDCLGFCGFNKTCYCPECITEYDNYCVSYTCSNNHFSSSGCIRNEMICSNSTKCLKVTKDIHNPSCCVYNNTKCSSYNKCYLPTCDPNTGCKTIKRECYKYYACSIPDCNDVSGECINFVNEALCPNKQCVSLSATNYSCTETTCETNSSCGVDDACGSWYCKNGRCNYISNCQYDICHYLESCSVINNTAVCNIKPKKYFTLSKCSTCVCSTVTGKFSCTSKDCFSENVCESGKCDENTGNCIYTNRTYSGKDKCHNYKCIRDQVRYDFIWVLDSNKCIDYPCKNTLCSIDGKCLYEDILCVNNSDKCFTYSCVNNQCVRNILDKSLLNPCDECIKEYHKLGLYLDYNMSLCNTYINEFNFTIISEDSSNESVIESNITSSSINNISSSNDSDNKHNSEYIIVDSSNIINLNILLMLILIIFFI